MAKKTTQTNKQHVRLAAEYLIASELNRRRLHAGIQVGTSVAYDIAAFDDYGHIAYLEVKGTQKPGWILGEKAKRKRNKNIFYALIAFGTVKNTEKPEIFIVPAAVVAKTLVRRNKLALGFHDFAIQKYKEAWNLLRLKPSKQFREK